MSMCISVEISVFIMYIHTESPSDRMSVSLAEFYFVFPYLFTDYQHSFLQ